MKSLFVRIAVAAMLAFPAVACTSTPKQESTGQYIDSATITAKVRAKLVADAELNPFQIGVETFKDRVQLSGFVKTQHVKDKAGTVAASVEGVKDVQNDLIVK
jgi:osmotically-inducible protein OsmY